MWLCRYHEALWCALGHHLRKAAPLLLLRRRPGCAVGLLLPVAAPGLTLKLAWLTNRRTFSPSALVAGALAVMARCTDAGSCVLGPAGAAASCSSGQHNNGSDAWCKTVGCASAMHAPLYHASLKTLRSGTEGLSECQTPCAPESCHGAQLASVAQACEAYSAGRGGCNSG